MLYNPHYYTLDKIPDYKQQYINIKLNRFLEKYKNTRTPIDWVKLLHEIKKTNDIDICYTLVPDMPNKFDAQARYYSNEPTFMVLINEAKARMHYPFKRSRDRRFNFTLAHEIAHIILNHLQISNEHKSPNMLEIEDLEADEFAARLLIPEDKLLTCNFVSLEKVAAEFNVSDQALWKRLNNLKCLDLLKNQPFYVCETCGNTEISPIAGFCKICGRELFNGNKGVITLKYDGFELNENGRVIICPQCENDEIGGNFCKICGLEVLNECTNDRCGTRADRNARYCEECGCTTTFYNRGLLKTWNIAKAALEGLPKEDIHALEEAERKAKEEAAAARNLMDDSIPW
jgi:Predicted Zn peptidase